MAEENLNLSEGDSKTPRIQASEVGTVGLSHLDGRILEQVREELRFPQVTNTLRKMYNDPMIYAAINLQVNMITKAVWTVQEPPNATEEEKKKTEFIRQCMEDMEHSWDSFIKNVSSLYLYGFSVAEKVFRRRKKSNGSKYDDNLIGWRKLSPRSQRTIDQWKFSKDGRTLQGLYQDLSNVSGTNRFDVVRNSKDYTPEGIYIKREKFMLFRYGGFSDNPEGESPLLPCYTLWKIKNIIQEHEAIGVSRDLRGVPYFEIPASYMSEDATDAEKAVYQEVQNIGRNLSNGEQSCIVMPNARDDSGNKVFDFKLVGVSGNSQYDTDKILKRYDDEILTALFSDILKLGQQSHGSFSLAGAKTNITAVNIAARLREIASVLNEDLIPQTFQMNGWDTTRLPKIVFEDLDEENLDDLSKMVQRLGSVNMLPRTPSIVSQTLKRAGYSKFEDVAEMDQQELDLTFTENRSGASEGMSEGMPSGTGDANMDGSSTNMENS